MQKMAVVKSIHNIIMADGKIADEEKLLMGNVINHLEVDKQTLIKALSMPDDVMAVMIRNMNDAEKDVIVNLWKITCAIDNEVDLKEINIIASMAKMCDIRIG